MPAPAPASTPVMSPVTGKRESLQPLFNNRENPQPVRESQPVQESRPIRASNEDKDRSKGRSPVKKSKKSKKSKSVSSTELQHFVKTFQVSYVSFVYESHPIATMVQERMEKGV